MRCVAASEFAKSEEVGLSVSGVDGLEVDDLELDDLELDDMEDLVKRNMADKYQKAARRRLLEADKKRYRRVSGTQAATRRRSICSRV